MKNQNNRDDDVTPTRRALLRTLAVGAGAAAVLPITVAPATAQSSPSAEETRGRYQENEWIRRYYALNRL
ncbi:MAG: hypothetical protein WCZ23_10525 [Rhodospirillaceae bacterium]